jgi:hypothetical protein
MKPSRKDQVEGKLHEVKGKLKEKTGRAVNDPNLETEGLGRKDGRQGPEEDWRDRKGPRELGRTLNKR